MSLLRRVILSACTVVALLPSQSMAMDDRELQWWGQQPQQQPHQQQQPQQQPQADTNQGALRGVFPRPIGATPLVPTPTAPTTTTTPTTPTTPTTTTTPTPTTPTPTTPNLVSSFKAAEGIGLYPQNLKYLGNNTLQMTIKPGQEAIRIVSSQNYTGGRYVFRCQTASVMSGIVTSFYLASGQGRTSDVDLGGQDEIDLEWKGLTPTQLQTNLFLGGHEAMQVDDLGFNGNEEMADYAIDWDDHKVTFYVKDREIRTIYLDRPLKPMHLEISVWTTKNGWPGLLQWAGVTDWPSRNNKPAVATFQILALPTSRPHGEVTAPSYRQEQPGQ